MTTQISYHTRDGTRWCAHGTVQDSKRYPNPAGEGLRAEELGGTHRQAGGHEQGQGGPRKEARGCDASHAR